MNLRTCSQPNRVNENPDVVMALVHAYDFISLSKAEYHQLYGIPKRAEKRYSSTGPWLKDIRTNGVGQACPTCFVRMKHSSLGRHDSVTVEHVVPLCTGGKNIKRGTHPNCIPMCHACNKTRNDVLMRFGKKISTVKFLLDQVYGEGTELNPKMNAFFQKRLQHHKEMKPRHLISAGPTGQQKNRALAN